MNYPLREMNDGWIKLHRKILDWEWYDDFNTWKLFIHLLLTVNYEDKRWRGKEIKRGERITSYPKLSEETKLTVRQIRTAMDKLRLTGEVTRLKATFYTHVRVNNYNQYQQDDRSSVTTLTEERQKSDRPVTTTKERKEVKKEKETDFLLPKKRPNPPKGYMIFGDDFEIIEHQE